MIEFVFLYSLVVARSVVSAAHPDVPLVPADLAGADVLVLNDMSTGAFEVSWNSQALDGSYRLFIGPEQIYLRSGHNNPNPNHLYWVAPSSPEVYAAASKAFGKPKPPFSLIDERDVWLAKPPHGENAAKNLAFVLARLNAALAKGGKPVVAPSAKELGIKVRIVSGDFELPAAVTPSGVPRTSDK